MVALYACAKVPPALSVQGTQPVTEALVSSGTGSGQEQRLREGDATEVKSVNCEPESHPLTPLFLSYLSFFLVECAVPGPVF